VGNKILYKFHELTQMMAVPWLSRLAPELSLRRTKCNSRSVHEIVVMDTVACFPPTTASFLCHYHSASAPLSYSSYNTALVTRASGRILGTLKNNSAISHIRESGQKYTVAKFWWISLFKTVLTSTIPPMLHTRLYLRISLSWKGKGGEACNLQRRNFLSDTEQHWTEE